MFVLTRTTPDGVEKQHSPAARKRDAATAAAHVLADNTGVDKAEAQRFAASLHRLPLGDTGVHGASGYRFRIDRA